jgi:hypothetical protein
MTRPDVIFSVKVSYPLDLDTFKETNARVRSIGGEEYYDGSGTHFQTQTREHFWFCPTEHDAEQIAERLEAAGFEPEVNELPDE